METTDTAMCKERYLKDGLAADEYEYQVRQLAKFIDQDDLSVLDFSRGTILLRALLPADITYYSVDCGHKCEHTAVCDFNNGEFPQQKADVAFMHGVVEIVKQPELLMRNAMLCTNKIILSFRKIETPSNPDFNQNNTTCNDFTLEKIIRYFHDNGWMLRADSMIDKAQALLCFIKAKPGLLCKNFFCTGCSACMAACPTGALNLQKNEDGFFRPIYEESLCTECGKCTAVCPTLHPTYDFSANPDCFAFLAEDDIRYTSSSGGVFPLLARKTLERGGLVCGAAWNETLGVQHIVVASEDDLPKLFRSKYVQSDMGNVLPAIEQALQQNKEVLFSGCPCQVAGLQSFLGKDYDNLYTIELLCHYSPSQTHFGQYLNDVFAGECVEYDFRVKDAGWSSFTHRVKMNDGTVHIRSGFDDPFQQGFHPRLFMNSSCENCRFCSYPRQGDLIIGDFHGIREHDQMLDDTKGSSVVLVNNTKGRRMLDEIRPQAKIYKQTPLEWVSNNRVSANFPAHPGRDRFYELIKEMPFSRAVDYAINGKYDVGVVGIWSVENHGSNLTYYALYQILRDMGLQPLMIERPQEAAWKPHIYPIGFKHNPYRSFDLAPIYQTKSEMRQLNNICELFIAGSDQLLNDHLYHQFAKYITLDWVEDHKQKSAYAASFGSDNFLGNDATRADMAYHMNKFDYFSVREKSGILLAQNEFATKAEFVLDPVFLCDRKHFDALAQKGTEITSPYIAAYILDQSIEKQQLITAFEQKFGFSANCFADAQQRALGDTALDNPYWDEKNGRSLYNEDWLRNIVDSEFVIADSFHGICFAIIYHKPFVAIANNGRGLARFLSLLEMLNLEDRLAVQPYDFERILSLPPIDYDEVDRVLAQQRSKSFEILQKMATQSIQKKPHSTADYLAVAQNRQNDLQQSLESYILQAKQRFEAIDTFAQYVGSRFEEISQQTYAITLDIGNQMDAIRLEREKDKAETEQRFQAINNSKSFRIGRAITWLPRKILKLLAKDTQ